MSTNTYPWDDGKTPGRFETGIELRNADGAKGRFEKVMVFLTQINNERMHELEEDKDYQNVLDEVIRLASKTGGRSRRNRSNRSRRRNRSRR